MRTDVIFAGLGGQGLLTMGQVLAVAAIREGKQTSWLPSYSPEVRGGWANCTVVVSDDSIGSPTVGRPAALVALESTALAKHAPSVRPGGVIVVNSSLAPEDPCRSDVRLVRVPATQIANELGNERVVNSIMLGAYASATGAVRLDSLAEAVRDQLKDRPSLIDVNMEALRRGAAAVSAQEPEGA